MLLSTSIIHVLGLRFNPFHGTMKEIELLMGIMRAFKRVNSNSARIQTMVDDIDVHARVYYEHCI